MRLLLSTTILIVSSSAFGTPLGNLGGSASSSQLTGKETPFLGHNLSYELPASNHIEPPDQTHKIYPRPMESQAAVNCRDQANVARSVAQSLKGGLTFEQAYQKVQGMPFSNEGLLTLKSYVQDYYRYPTRVLSQSLEATWHQAFVGCMPTDTYQTIRLPDGTYTVKETPISRSLKKQEDEQVYTPKSN